MRLVCGFVFLCDCVNFLFSEVFVLEECSESGYWIRRMVIKVEVAQCE